MAVVCRLGYCKMSVALFGDSSVALEMFGIDCMLNWWWWCCLRVAVAVAAAELDKGVSFRPLNLMLKPVLVHFGIALIEAAMAVVAVGAVEIVEAVDAAAVVMILMVVVDSLVQIYSGSHPVPVHH